MPHQTHPSPTPYYPPTLQHNYPFSAYDFNFLRTSVPALLLQHILSSYFDIFSTTLLPDTRSHHISLIALLITSTPTHHLLDTTKAALQHNILSTKPHTRAFWISLLETQLLFFQILPYSPVKAKTTRHVITVSTVELVVSRDFTP